MDHFEDIKRLRELQTALESLTGQLGLAITALAIAKSQLAINDGRVKDLSQRKSTVEEAIRVEKISIANLPK